MRRVRPESGTADSGKRTMVPITSEERRLLTILDRDPRYALGAYEFVRNSVSYASEVVYATGTHVTGRELLEAIRRLAREQFGLMTADVLSSWGVRGTEDFGEIVFNLVDKGLLSKTDDDSREDFRGVYSFDDAFSTSEYWQEVLKSSR
jgi:uncharacterized repeat protein (TIGR04138 family)